MHCTTDCEGEKNHSMDALRISHTVGSLGPFPCFMLTVRQKYEERQNLGVSRQSSCFVQKGKSSERGKEGDFWRDRTQTKGPLSTPCVSEIVSNFINYRQRE